MFPNLGNNVIFDDFLIFKGIREINDYFILEYKTKFDNPGTMARFIRELKADSDGFIIPNNITYKYVFRKKYTIDFNQEYVFVYFNDILFTGFLPYAIILKFLKYKSKKILLIYEDIYIFIEKTPDTYHICAELEKIYLDNNFFNKNIISKINYVKVFEECYINLLNEYKKKIGKENVEYENDIEILIKLLGLNIEKSNY